MKSSPDEVDGEWKRSRRLDRIALGVLLVTFALVAMFIGFGEALVEHPAKGSIELWGWEVVRFREPHSAVQTILAWSAAALALATVVLAFVRPRHRPARLIAFGLIVGVASTAFFFGSLKTAFTRDAYFDAADDVHYVMGTKYFAEVGYVDLYTCMAVARADSGHRNPTYMRSLRDNKVRRLHALVDAEAVERCHRRFGERRWAEFRDDVEKFEAWPRSRDWSSIFRDHGYNGTPLRTAIESPLTNAFEISQRTLCRAGIADVAIVAIACGLAIWAFGWRTGALLLGLYWVNFLDFSFMGGAFLRYVGAASILICLSLLKLERPVAAGCVLSLGAGIVVFPALFFAGAIVVAVVEFARTRRVPATVVRFIAAGAIGGAILFAWSVADGGGLAAWGEFAHQMGLESGRLSPGRVGFVYNLIFPKELLADGVDLPPYEQRIETLRAGPLGFLFAPGTRYVLVAGLLYFIGRQRRTLDLTAYSALMGFSLLFLLLSTVRYYYAGMVGLLLVWHAHEPSRGTAILIAALFAWSSTGHFIWEATAEAFRCNTLASGFLTAYLVSAIVYLERTRIRSPAVPSGGYPAGERRGESRGRGGDRPRPRQPSAPARDDGAARTPAASSPR